MLPTAAAIPMWGLTYADQLNACTWSRAICSANSMRTALAQDSWAINAAVTVLGWVATHEAGSCANDHAFALVMHLTAGSAAVRPLR